ncbi:NAD(P)H-hydrate dehydratase [Candidatus Micrarchaeota archaeon]|nr:NAD(P)H-hydrate dehydratase [Candidatus Micrarchaeota archaeon]
MNSEVITSRIMKKLYVAPENSHKGQNGVLTIIGGSKKYHGAPLLAISAASRFADLLYFHSPEKQNNSLLQFLKSKKSTFIAIGKSEIAATIKKSDCVLIGNGLELNPQNKRLVNSLLKKFPSKKFILDAGALHLVDKKLLSENVCLTPHMLEFASLFGKPASEQTVVEMASKCNCVILLKHPDGDLVSDGYEIAKNFTGNEGMTKGGTGDVLAGLLAAIACKNDLFTSAKSAAFLNGYAGDLLKKRMGTNFDAQDLADELANAYMEAKK